MNHDDGRSRSIIALDGKENGRGLYMSGIDSWKVFMNSLLNLPSNIQRVYCVRPSWWLCGAAFRHGCKQVPNQAIKITEKT